MSLLLAGCCGFLTPKLDPTQFYILQSPQGYEHSPCCLKTHVQPLSLGIARIRFPAYLQPMNMAKQVSCHELVYSEFHRWAEPLEEGFSRVLADHLRSELKGSTFYTAPWNFPLQHEYELVLEVVDFLPIVQENRILLSARWKIHKRGEEVILQEGHAEISQPMFEQGYEQVVEAMAGAVAQLSSRLAQEINSAINPSTS